MKYEEKTTANLLNDGLIGDKIAGVYYKDGSYCLYLNRGSKTERWTSSDLTEWQKQGTVINEKGKPFKMKEGSFLFRNGKTCFFQSEINGVAMYSSADGLQFIKHPVPVVGLSKTPGLKFKYAAPKMFYSNGNYHMALGCGGKLHWLKSDRLTDWEYVFPLISGDENVVGVFGCDGKVGVLTQQKDSDSVVCGELKVDESTFAAEEKRGCYRYITPKSVALPNGTVQLFYLIPKERADAKEFAQKKVCKGAKTLCVGRISMKEKEFMLTTPEEWRHRTGLLIEEEGVLDGVRSYRGLADAGCEGTFGGTGEWKTETTDGEWTVKTANGKTTLDGADLHLEEAGETVSVRMGAGGTEWRVNGKTVYADGTACRAEKMLLTGTDSAYRFKLFRFDNGEMV